MRDLASETRMPKPRAPKPGCLKPERRLGAENGAFGGPKSGCPKPEERYGSALTKQPSYDA